MKRVCCIVVALAYAALAAAQQESKRRPVGRKAEFPAISACGTDICSTSQPHACIQVTYPETAWRTCISNQGRRGLVLGPTDLRRTPTSPWMRVLGEAGIAEIFVPYHSLPLRLYDTQTASLASLLAMNASDLGPKGELITLSAQTVPQVAAEWSDRGVAWLCKNSRQMVRRGFELALWGVFDAQNYDFIIDYRLRDDGSIGFRLGATGFNNPYFPSQSTTDPHMHSVLWRVDVDLNGAEGDSALTITHREGERPPFQIAEDVEEPFNGGVEGVITWDPLRFLSIAVQDTSVNVYGKRIGYALRARPEGLSRHYGEEAGLPRKEKFTKSDFGVTRYKAAEREAFFDVANAFWLSPDEYLLGEPPFAGVGVSDRESITDTNLVLWYRSSAHHHPHDEDRAPGDPADLMTGITLVHWTGFDLEPWNLFDFNPLGGPSRADCW